MERRGGRGRQTDLTVEEEAGEAADVGGVRPTVAAFETDVGARNTGVQWPRKLGMALGLQPESIGISAPHL